jgi:AhpD family alkylhydroperoxidase
MEARLEIEDFERLAPEGRAALTALSKAAAATGLEKSLIELIKIRASQINGCAFCVQFHLNLAHKLRVSQRKIDLVAVWREARIFSQREMAALEWTEELTGITPRGVTDEIYSRVSREFDAAQLAALTTAVVSINAWNRIAIAYRFTPPAALEEDRAISQEGVTA